MEVDTTTLALIALIVPAVVRGLKTAMPKLPKGALPWVAGALGVFSQVGMALASPEGVALTDPLIGAIAGYAGVGLRESVDQVWKARQRKAKNKEYSDKARLSPDLLKDKGR